MSAESLQADYANHHSGTAAEFCVRVADIPTSVVCNEPDMNVEIDYATRKFLVAEVEPDVRVEIGWDDLRGETFGEQIFDSGGLWQMYREQGGYLIRFATPFFGDVPYRVASFDRDFTFGRVRLHRPYFFDRVLYPLEYPLDELLMLNLLARGKGAEFHTCGVVDSSGAGYLFMGQSGAGKTTTARLWEPLPGVKVLSDDRIVLRKVDGRMWMYGTPWHGEAELSSADKAPLAKIFFLRHGQKNELRLLGQVEAAARLFSCSFPTFYNTDGLDFTLAFYEEVTSTVPCYELDFVPDQRVIDFIRRQ